MTNHHSQSANGRLRARGLGLRFAGMPGPFNAITDVSGVEVGFCSIMSDAPMARTGVTAILPRGRLNAAIPCAAGAFSFNGNGEMSGLAWIEENGELQTPITITNTHSCGVARDATLRWLHQAGIGYGQDFGLPVAAETYDGELNDINGFHVSNTHVMDALDDAKCGALAMGNVGGGTGMITYDFKGGSSTASRIVTVNGTPFTLGIFVQSNFGKREDLMVLGVPVGQHITEDKLRGLDAGSIIAIVATDAPFLPHQLKRLARRVTLGLARTGTIGGNGSGDIFLAFSTANMGPRDYNNAIITGSWLSNSVIDLFFRAVVEATEEAVIDAMITGETMTGRNGNTSLALPHQRLLDIMAQHGR
jgi:D-aminopeptidase